MQGVLQLVLCDVCLCGTGLLAPSVSHTGALPVEPLFAAHKGTKAGTKLACARC